MAKILIQDQNSATKALNELVDSINSTGGLVHIKNDEDIWELVPQADQHWPDLAETYITACHALGRLPMIDGQIEEYQKGT